MQNISYVLSLMGREWMSGLKPAKNVGLRVAAQIEQLIMEAEGRQVHPTVAFEIEVLENMRKKSLPKPAGTVTPITISSNTSRHQRDEMVRAWILKQANGICECCDRPAPFYRSDGVPYLEVHHVRMLADNGPDVVENAVAVCPNCHRELHYGQDTKELVEQLYQKVTRLNREQPMINSLQT
ncbi:MAG: hypothetical protein NVS3B3_21100 [Aquirhabdus sp.]